MRVRVTKRRVVWAVVAAVVVLAGLGLWRRAAVADTTPATVAMQLETAGGPRTYLLDAPTGVAPAAGRPLLILMHGGGGTANSLDKQTGGLPALATAAGYVVARPQGLNRQWNDGREVNRDVDDVAFIRAMVDDIASRQPIDRGRLYAAGISNGGFMSGRLACEADLGIAAIAQVAATLGIDTDAACDPGHPVSVLAILGDADPIVPYAGGPVRLPWDNSETGRGIVAGRRGVPRCAGSSATGQEPRSTAHRSPPMPRVSSPRRRRAPRSSWSPSKAAATPGRAACSTCRRSSSARSPTRSPPRS